MRVVKKPSTFNLDVLNESILKRKGTQNEMSRKSKNANRITSGFESMAPQLSPNNGGSHNQITNSINFDFD